MKWALANPLDVSTRSFIGYNLANITPSTHRVAHLVYQLTISLFQFSFTPVYQSYEILFKVSIATLFLIHYNSLQLYNNYLSKVSLQRKIAGPCVYSILEYLK